MDVGLRLVEEVALQQGIGVAAGLNAAELGPVGVRPIEAEQLPVRWLSCGFSRITLSWTLVNRSLKVSVRRPCRRPGRSWCPPLLVVRVVSQPTPHASCETRNRRL